MSSLTDRFAPSPLPARAASSIMVVRSVLAQRQQVHRWRGGQLEVVAAPLQALPPDAALLQDECVQRPEV
jgi:hypothetical protein